MNKEVKKLWLDALKSRQYVQGKGRLRKTVLGSDCFCCLGVLCDLSISNYNSSSRWGVRKDAIAGGRVFKFKNEGGGCGGLPPYEVLDWAGLTTSVAQDLSTINDQPRTPENAHFAEVIESIESTL